MDLLMETGAVKLRSHLNKFLIGDETTETVRQSKNGSSKQSIWIVELCQNNPDAIKLKNLYTGLYLTASDTPFLLGMTGKRVVQLSIFDPTRVEWEPISNGFQVKFRSTKEGKYLRGNGGMPPWRNSVTHDSPLTGRTYNWVLWDVEPVSEVEFGSGLDALSRSSSFNSVFSDEHDGLSYPTSPMSVISTLTSFSSVKQLTGMDLFCNAIAVRLKSHHDKYLYAEEDEESVSQDRNGSTQNARWEVELGEDRIIRLKSCYGKYLTATSHPFLLGVTGKKVMQTGELRNEPAVEWEPLRVGSQTQLRTKDGNYLRANGGLPPWRNSVTHDLPNRTATQDWVLWDVDIVEFLDLSAESQVIELDWKIKHGMRDGLIQSEVVQPGSFKSGLVSHGSKRYRRLESSEFSTPLPKPDGRLIYYHIADESSDVNDAVEGSSFLFKGHSVLELTQELKKETGFEEIYACTRSPLDEKLYPLHLQLPPNSTTMHIVVVPSTSKLTTDFREAAII